MVQAGHGRRELADAGARQASQLAYFPVWGYAHPTAIELAERLSELAPGDINRVFFTTGGSEAVESAWKLARQYFKVIGQPQRTKAISREISYHGTTMGALSITGYEAIKKPFEPLVPVLPGSPTPTSSGPRCTATTWRRSVCGRPTRSPNASRPKAPKPWPPFSSSPSRTPGGCFVPPPGYFARVREICDRYGVLLVSDEVICAFGRLGYWFGSERYGYQPDMITVAKGLTSGYAPMGALLASDRLIEPFLHGTDVVRTRDHVRRPPGVLRGGSGQPRHFRGREAPGPCPFQRGGLPSSLRTLEDLPIVGDVRGDGYFFGVELVKDKATKGTFNNEETERLLRGFLSPALFEAGLVCRADDRGDPVVQFAPPAYMRAGAFRHHRRGAPRRAQPGVGSI